MARKWKLHPTDLRWRVWCLCVRAWWGRKVKILRIHRLRSVLSGPVNSKPTFLRRILLVQRGPRYDEKGNRRDKGAKWAKKGLQKRLYPTPFEVQKVICLIKNALCSYSELCFLCRRGAHFQKNRETKVPESEKWNQKTLDGKYDGYMRGLDGAEEQKC